jgi:hypothetical protein
LSSWPCTRRSRRPGAGPTAGGMLRAYWWGKTRKGGGGRAQPAGNTRWSRRSSWGLRASVIKGSCPATSSTTALRSVLYHDRALSPNTYTLTHTHTLSLTLSQTRCHVRGEGRPYVSSKSSRAMVLVRSAPPFVYSSTIPWGDAAQVSEPGHAGRQGKPFYRAGGSEGETA